MIKMMFIECPKPAYEKIVNNKALFDRIIKKRDKWHDILLSAYIDGETAWKIFDKAEEYFKDFTDVGDMKDVFLDILELRNKAEDDYYISKEEGLMKYPALIAYSILGKGILKPEKYGFSSRKQLEESIASFCIGERWNLDYFYRERYVWRNGKYKNMFTNAVHGDFYLGQTDVSGDYQIHNTLFGDKEEFDTWKDTTYCGDGIAAHWPNWDIFLMIALRYAESIGKGRIPEIVSWRDIEKELDGSAPPTAEVMFGGSDDLSVHMLSDSPIFIEGKELEMWPLGIISGMGSDTIPNIPYVKDRKLIFMRENENGDTVLFNKGSYAGKKFSSSLIFEESDLIDLLKGTYKLFARDRALMPKLIDSYLKNPHK